jgi:steroid delta-isomerase-like uncharacterized protein
MRSPQSLLCDWFEQVWNRRDADAIHRLASGDLKAHGADGVTRSADDFTEFQRLLVAALPDIRLQVTHCVEAGDMAAAHWIATGTHTGATKELGPATGRTVEISGLSMARIENGRFVEGWDDYDHAALMRQLGAAAERRP